jgi:glucuronoarabinoxylan endo-1,4-beta-xylanase
MERSETVQMDFSLKITMLYNGTPSTGVNPIEDMLPKKFSLSQNFPNPFNPTTVISYQLPISNWVTLKVYDVLGKEVASIVNGVEEPGYKSVKFDATKLSSGPYFYRLQAGSFVQTNKMLLMK